MEAPDKQEQRNRLAELRCSYFRVEAPQGRYSANRKIEREIERKRAKETEREREDKEDEKKLRKPRNQLGSTFLRRTHRGTHGQ